MNLNVKSRLLVAMLIMVLSAGYCFGFNEGSRAQASKEMQLAIGRDIDDWQAVKGTWGAVRLQGQYVLTEEGTGSAAGVNEVILYPYELPDNYILSGQIYFSNPAQWAGIVFEAKGNLNDQEMYYLVRIRPEKPDKNGVQMLVWINGAVSTSYSSPWQTETGDFKTNAWIDITIERRPGRVKVKVDGREFESVFKVDPENMDVCKGGMPGFYANQSSLTWPIYFRNLKVASLDD